MIIYDAEGQILGRLSSVIAKQILDGETVEVVNVERALVSGNRKSIVSNYQVKVKRGDAYKGPFFPRTPIGIFKRTVRGMLPMKKAKGQRAFRNLKAHIGVPDHLKKKESEFKKSEAADASRLQAKTVALGKLSVSLGAKKRWED